MEVTLDLHVRNDSNTTIVSIQTNLPPKTKFMAMMISPINQGGDGLIRESKAEVQANQIVQFEDLSKNGRPLPSGHYVLHINALTEDLQPKDIRPVFGVRGERLTGPNVRRDATGNMVYHLYRFKLNPDGSITR